MTELPIECLCGLGLLVAMVVMWLIGLALAVADKPMEG